MLKIPFKWIFIALCTIFVAKKNHKCIILIGISLIIILKNIDSVYIYGFCKQRSYIVTSANLNPKRINNF